MKARTLSLRTQTLFLLVLLLAASTAAIATMTVQCAYCTQWTVGVATATPSGYYQYEWTVAPPGYASPPITNTNSTLVAYCPALFGFVLAKAYDSGHNLIDSGSTLCGL